MSRPSVGPPTVGYNRSISGENQPPSRPPPTLSSQLELNLKQRAEALADISRNLPRVVKCDRSTAPSIDLPFDITQPLLIYSKRSVRKIGARSVHYDRENKRYMDTGDDILVPQDYPGYFGVLGSPNNIKSEVNIPYYRSLTKLGITTCREFLVVGNTSINGFTRVGDKQEWETRKILPGDVLRKGGMFQERREYITKKSKIGKKKLKEPLVVIDVYLKCYDSDDREIVVPANQEGIFYVISQDGAPTKTPVLRIQDILQRYKFPLVVKLLFGAVPKTACAFKDTLLLTEAAVSHTVIASTMENLRNINLEIPLDSGMMFFVAEHNHNLTSSRQYRQALTDCEENVLSYMKNIKVLVGVTSQEYLPAPTSPPTPPPTPSPTPTQQASSAGPATPTTPEAPPANGTDDSPVIVRRGQVSTSGSLSRESRLSAISRIITLNSNEQNIFAPSLPKSPGTPPVQPNKHLSRKSKNSMPGDLEPMDGFEPPESPETIRANPVHQRSAVGNERRRAFVKNRQEQARYETPNSISIFSSQEPEVYGSLWHSSSTSRESAAGIRIRCKPGQPTLTHLGQSIAESDNRSLMDSPSPNFDSQHFYINPLDSQTSRDNMFPSSQEICSFDSSIRGSRQNSTSSSPSFSLSHFLPEDENLERRCNSESDSQYLYENTSGGALAFPSQTQRASDVPDRQNNQAPPAETARSQNVYSEPYDREEDENQGQKIPSSDRRPPENAGYIGPSPHSNTSGSVSGGYITPIDSNVYASYISQSATDEYDRPTNNGLREIGRTEDGISYFEVQDSEEEESRAHHPRDSGVYDGEDAVAAQPLEDHYDRPILGSGSIASYSSGSIYDIPHPEPPTSSSTITRPIHLNVEPPPLPQNHPSRGTPNSGTSVTDLIGRIRNIATPTPKKSNKEALIEELKKTGLKADSELAFLSLQAADLVMLAQRGDDLEDILCSLLPKVGRVDLSKIAMFIKGMRVALVNMQD